MKDSKPPNQEVIGDRLTEEISKLYKFAPGEGAGSCLVCGEDVGEGMEVSVVVFRRAGSPAFDVQYILCDYHLDEFPTEFTLGVREVVVRGWFGWCSVDERGLCPVVVSPEVVGVSEASTTSMREVQDGEGVGVELGDRLSCEGESSAGRAVPRMRVVMDLPGECRFERPVAGADDEKEVSADDE